MNYLNKLNPIIVNSEIIEYDIKSANTSIMREYNLLSEDRIAKIEAMSKDKRVVVVGKLMKKDKEFSKALEKSFNDAVSKFIEINGLSKDNDIVSIKKDAVFVVNKNIIQSQFGNVNFVKKNLYNYYVQIKRLEFYGTHDRIDVKGIDDNVVGLHKNGILNFIDNAVTEYESRNRKSIIAFYKNFCSMYKNKELDFDYYREFTSESKYKILTSKKTLTLDNMSEAFIDNLDISYNYNTIILPMIRLSEF